MCMGGNEPDYDAHCESCGAGYYFEVGFQITCDACGGSLTKPKPQDHPFVPDDSDLLDPDFMNFDEEKAFKYMKEHGLLHHAYRVEPDPVQDFLEAVDGGLDLDFDSFLGEYINQKPVSGSVFYHPPGQSVKSLKR